MKVHIDADMISGVVHDFVTNSANVHDLNVWTSVKSLQTKT